MATDLCSSDEEIISPVRDRLSLRKKRQRLTESDSDSCGDSGCVKRSGVRSSERIRRRHSREFRIPDKHEYWKRIPKEGSPHKSLKSLTPRKLVNNFTKVNNSYNAETYDTDEENMSDFIVDDDEIEDEENSSSESSHGSCVEEIIHRGRVDRYRTKSLSKHQRIIELSGSDSDSNDNRNQNINENAIYSAEKDIFPKQIGEKTSSSENNGISQINLCSKMKKSNSLESNSISKDSIMCENYSETMSDSDIDEIQTVKSGNKKRRFISSESECDSVLDFEGSFSTPLVKRSAAARTKERSKQRKELFKGLKNSRKKSS